MSSSSQFYSLLYRGNYPDSRLDLIGRSPAAWRMMLQVLLWREDAFPSSWPK